MEKIVINGMEGARTEEISGGEGRVKDYKKNLWVYFS